MWEEIKTTDFSFYIGKKIVCVCLCVCGCVYVCVCREKMPPMQLLTAAVWLMDRLFAEGCWLRDILTKIWLAKPKAYFITHKTFHLLVLGSTERPSLSAECGWIPCLWTTLPVLHLSDTPTLQCSTLFVCLWWQWSCCMTQTLFKND